MKRISIILLLALLLIGNGLWAQFVKSTSSQSTYTDDAYYWPVIDTIAPTEPLYDKNAREFIFIEDTTQNSETVRMRILEPSNDK